MRIHPRVAFAHSLADECRSPVGMTWDFNVGKLQFLLERILKIKEAHWGWVYSEAQSALWAGVEQIGKKPFFYEEDVRELVNADV